jgi:hypothetical protein
MDFDSAMELLDQAETALPGQEFKQLEAGSPDVQISQWGTIDNKPESCNTFGLFVHNNGRDAHKIKIFPPLKLGRYILFTSGHLPLLLNEHNTAFLEVSMKDSNGWVVPNTLAEVIRDNPEVLANGTKLAPQLRLVYQSSSDNWLASTFEMYVSAAGSIAFTFIKRELLVMSMPQELDAGT